MSFPRTRESRMPLALSGRAVYETTRANRIGRVASWILASARMTNVAVVSSRLLSANSLRDLEAKFPALQSREFLHDRREFVSPFGREQGNRAKTGFG
jgi:hypothetical protein